MGEDEQDDVPDVGDRSVPRRDVMGRFGGDTTLDERPILGARVVPGGSDERATPSVDAARGL